MSRLDLQLITRLVYICVSFSGEGAGFGHLCGVSRFLRCICQTLILEAYAELCLRAHSLAVVSVVPKTLGVLGPRLLL